MPSTLALCVIFLAFVSCNGNDIDFSQLLAGRTANGQSKQDIRIPLDFHPDLFNADTLLDEARRISDRIIRLTETVNELRNSLNNTKHTYHPTLKGAITEMDKVSARAAETQQRLQQLQQKLTPIKTALSGHEDTVKCFAKSSCVTKPPHTGKPTTPPPTTCVPPNGEIIKVDKESYTLKSVNYPILQSHYSCNYIMQTVPGYTFKLSGAINIEGGASLTITEPDSGTLIKKFTKSVEDIGPIKTQTKVAKVEFTTPYSAEDSIYSRIAFRIVFEKVDRCDGYDCGNGKCTTQPDNSIYCNCDPCVMQDEDGKCTKEMFDPCTTYERRCTLYGKGHCVKTADCQAMCKCDGIEELKPFCR